jgi:hypothetical protein
VIHRTDKSDRHCSATRITKPLPLPQKLGEDVLTSEHREAEMYTEQELQSMATEQLQKLNADFGLFVNNDRPFLIRGVLMAQRYPKQVESIKANRSAE